MHVLCVCCRPDMGETGSRSNPRGRKRILHGNFHRRPRHWASQRNISSLRSIRLDSTETGRRTLPSLQLIPRALLSLAQSSGLTIPGKRSRSIEPAHTPLFRCMLQSLRPVFTSSSCWRRIRWSLAFVLALPLTTLDGLKKRVFFSS